MKLVGYIAKRIIYTVVSLWALSVLIFAMTQVIPGNAADIILGGFGTPERVAAVEARLGLNRPIYFQYFDWITSVITGDWGRSYIQNRPITEIVLPKFVASFQLTIVSLSLVILISIPLGTVAAARKGSTIDSVITSLAYIGISIPGFVSGIILITIFAGPFFSFFPSGRYAPLSEGFWEWASHIILPAITLTIISVAHITRQTRSGMTSALQSDYSRTARLKGLSEFNVIRRHALRNGLLPAITVLALNFGWMMGSLVVIETVFSFPGLGRLVIRSILTRDLPLLQLSVLIIASSYMFANLTADILYTILDPRIDLEGAK